MDAAFEQRVRERAYEIWVAAGMENGAADLHWLSAEQSVMNEGPQPTVSMKKAASKKPTVKKAAPASKASKKVVHA